MVEDSKGGKLLVRDVPSIGGGEAQMTIPAAEVCAAAGRNSETMRRDVDEEVLVPLLRATAKDKRHPWLNLSMSLFRIASQI